MTLVRYAVPEQFYFDHTSITNEDDHSLPSRRPGPDINVKQQIQEALVHGEREYLLQLAESFERLINDKRIQLKSTTFTAYQRFLVYCCSVYYNLAFGVDYITLEIFVVRTPASRIPPCRIADLVPAAPELSTSNLRAANLQLKGSTSTIGPVPIAPLQNTSGAQVTIAEREAAYQAAVARLFAEEDPEEKTNNNDNNVGVGEGISSIRILPRSESPPEKGENSIDKEDVQDRVLPLGARTLIKRPVLTLVEREAAYEEARRRIFTSYEDKTSEPEDPDFNISITSTIDKPYISFQPGRPSNNRVRFQPNPDWISSGKDRSSVKTPVPRGVSKKSSEDDDDDAVETSEFSSTSGADSIYSYASSRTKSTDYGLYYRHRALSDEDLAEIAPRFWRPLGTTLLHKRPPSSSSLTLFKPVQTSQD